MTRIPLDPPRTPLYRLAEWYSRRSYGVVAEPLAAMGHNLRVLLDRRPLRDLAGPLEAAGPDAEGAGRHGRRPSTIGCSWCMDFGYWVSSQRRRRPGQAARRPALAGQRRLHRPGAAGHGVRRGDDRDPAEP